MTTGARFGRTITVRVTDEMYEWLGVNATLLGLSLVSFVRMLLTQALHEREETAA